MNIGIIPDCLGYTSVKKAIERSAHLGFRGIQPYATTGDISPESLTVTGRSDLKRFVQGLGLIFSALIGDFGGGGFADEATLQWRVEHTAGVIELAQDLDAGIVSTHVGSLPGDASGAWSSMVGAVRELSDFAYGRGIFLAAETGTEEPELLKKFIGAVASPGFKVNYDPANLVMVAGVDPVKGVYTLGEYIVHTHVKDGLKLHSERGEKRWKETPLGEGGVDFLSYFKALREIDYSGFHVIERESGDNREEDIIEGKEFLQNLNIS